MKAVWIVGQLLFLVMSIVCTIFKRPNDASQFLIMSFEMAILFKLEGE